MNALLLFACSLLAVCGQQVVSAYSHHLDADGLHHAMWKAHHHHHLGSFNAYLLKKQYENMMAKRDKEQRVLASNYVDEYPLAHGISSDFSNAYVYPAPPHSHLTSTVIGEPSVIIVKVSDATAADTNEENAITFAKRVTVHSDGKAMVEHVSKVQGLELTHLLMMLAHAKVEQEENSEIAPPPLTLLDFIKAHATMYRVKKEEDCDDDDEQEDIKGDDPTNEEVAESFMPTSYPATAYSTAADAHDDGPYTLPFNTQVANKALQEANDPYKRIQELHNVKADYSQRKLVEDPNVAKDVDDLHDSAMHTDAAGHARKKRRAFIPLVATGGAFVGGPTVIVPERVVPVAVGVPVIEGRFHREFRDHHRDHHRDHENRHHDEHRHHGHGDK